MPTNLTGSTIASTFDQVLHVDDGPTATEKTVYSGTGVATALKVSTLSVSVDNVRIDGNTISTLDTNGNLVLAPNGTGTVAIANAAITGGSITGATVAFASLAGRAYAAFSDVTDQTGSISAATPVKFGTTEVTGAGITMVTDGTNLTRLTLAAAGTYMVAPSLQFVNTDSNDHDVTVWLALNGTAIARSATRVTVPKAADGGAAFFSVVFYATVTAAQYIQVMWLPEDVSVTLDHTVAGAIAPAVPSAIVVAERIA
jgi:hypothetical protein